jgi:Neuraminidase (sialidase)
MVIGTFAAGAGALSQAAAGNYRMPPFVMHCVDPTSGRIYAIHNDVTQTVNGQADLNLLLRDSTDGGQTWSAPRIVNGDGTPPGDQVMPWIECDEQGRLHIAYFDNRRNPAPDAAPSTLLDVYYAMSRDGGHTWQETRLTTTPLDTATSNWSPYGTPTQFVGDYLGIALSHNAAYVAYPGAASNGVALMVTRIDFGDRIFADGFD